MKENNVIYLVDVLKEKKEIPQVHEKLFAFKEDNSSALLIKRAIAFVVDIFTVVLLKTSMDTAYSIYVNSNLSPVKYSQKIDLLQSNILVHLSTFLALYFGYFLYTTYILNGKTLGKMVMALRVVSDDYFRNKDVMESTISLKMSLKRSIGYLVCYLSFGTFFIFNFSSEDKRGLSDFISGSRTVSDQWFFSEMERRTYDSEAIYIDIKKLQSA